MAEELKALIEKIHEEGVKAAEDKARSIEAEAQARADAAAREARDEAKVIVEKARAEATQLLESGTASLKHAGRDLLLSLKKEISSMLEGIIARHVAEVLSPDEISRLIRACIKDYAASGEGGIVIQAKTEDIERLRETLFKELAGEVKRGVTLKASDDIRAGFTISYDAARSYFDFTEKAIADYIGAQLKGALAGILDGAASGTKDA